MMENDSISTCSNLNVLVKDIRLDAFIGVHGYEKLDRQPVIVSVDLSLHPIDRDDLSQTIDYNIVVEEAQKLADMGLSLIETFARLLAEKLMKRGKLLSVKVEIEKPDALDNGRAFAVFSM